MKRFTVCIAVYNQMNYIETALKSVFNQDYKNIEVIIADDCSPDFDLKKVKGIIEKYNVNNFKYEIIHNENNLGTVRNLNNAIDYATGDYILFFAGDDKLYNEHVITNFINSFKKNPQAGIITSQCFLYDSEIKKINHILITKNEAYRINDVSARKQYFYMCKNCFYASGATAYKMDKIIQYNKFSTKYKYVEDWALWLRMLRNGEKIIYKNFVTLCHRDGGISHSPSEKTSLHILEYYKDMKKIYFNEIFKYFYKFNIFELIELFGIVLKKIFKFNKKKNIRYDKNIHSFIICAYKEEHHLEDCVESLLTQSVDSEVMISTSTPNDYIESIANKYNLKLLINKGKAGHIEDFNFAFKKAKTKYVTLCHQDDVYYKNFGREVINKMENNKRPIIAFTNYNELRNGKTIKFNSVLLVKRFINLLLPIFKNSKKYRMFTLSLGNAISAPSVTYNTEVLNRSLIDSGYKSNIDWITYIEFAKLDGQFVYIRKPLVEHRIHQNSTTTSVINNNIKSEEDYKIFCKFWPKYIAKVFLKVYSQSEKSNSLNKKGK